MLLGENVYNYLMLPNIFNANANMLLKEAKYITVVDLYCVKNSQTG